MEFPDFDPLPDPRDEAEEHGDGPLGRGVPGDWAAVASCPARITLPDPGWRKLLYRYAGMGPSEPLDWILRETVGKERPTRVMLESGYIDADYRDEYASFYSRVYRPLPSRCERLHFFEDASAEVQYFGYVILRPIVGRPVCRTMLSPPRDLRDHISCVARTTATLDGFPLSVEGFPFISQDSQYGTCSHASMWMISLYYHLRFKRPRHFLSDLTNAARVHQDLLPAVPSGGLTPRQIVAVLHDLQMPPLVYRIDRRLPPDETAETIACRYLDSRLPVMVLSDGDAAGHARVLIGYKRTRAGELQFIYHDDQRGPYLTTKAGLDTADPDGKRWHALIVPLPGRIYMSGETAERTGKLIFEETFERHEPLRSLVGGLAAGRLRLRSHVCEVAEYKRLLRHRGLPDDVVRWHLNAGASHWLWIVELQDVSAATLGRDCVVGEIAIDATSDDQWANALFANLPGLVLRWPELGDEIDEADSTQGFAPYVTGCALHA